MDVGWVTSWYAHLGAALPADATVSAIRDVVSFNGHALAPPLLTLCLWAGIAAIVLVLPVPRLSRRRLRPATALTPVSSAAA